MNTAGLYKKGVTKTLLIAWLRRWFRENGGKYAVVGISGGKDSFVTAKLLCEALGKDRVFGVLMPNGEQKDITDSRRIVEYLGIRFTTVNIKAGNDGLLGEVGKALNGLNINLDEYAKINTPARMRMATLYAIAGCIDGRVANTCNLSEDYVGYATKYGDGAGDFSPLNGLTVREVILLGLELGLPEDLVRKTPSDGLCGKTDEDNLGFTYETLDGYLLGDENVPGLTDEIIENIENRRVKNLHKLTFMEGFTGKI